MIPRWIYLGVGLAAISYLLLGFIEDRQGRVTDRDEVILRTIGHQMLSKIGDDSSRVMPIEKKEGGEYLIRFERVFAIHPDTLVGIVRAHLQGYPFSQEYIFQVLECENKKVVYSFSIETDSSNNLIPCTGRPLPENCYIMRVVFNQPKNYQWYTILLLPFLFSFGYIWERKKVKPITAEVAVDDIPDKKPTTDFSLGRFQFNFNEQRVYLGEERIALSVKEAELLHLFVQAPNQLLERDYLLKTIWEDQGVFTGRSLDVFVSKLRKKLNQDPNVNLVSVHGKGYRLEIKED